MNINRLYEQNMSFLLLLALTIISSIVAYQLIIRAYDTAFAIDMMEISE